MLDRIPKLIKSKNISASQFADEIGVQRSSVSHVLSGRNKPSLDFITKIIVTYPDVNPNWLLTGSGNIYTEDRDDDSTISASDHQSMPEMEDVGLIGAEQTRDLPGTRIKKTGRSKTTTGSEAINRIVIFFRNGTFEEFTSGK